MQAVDRIEVRDLHSHGRYRAGIDIGGTFTDLVLIDDETGKQAVGKILTTPHDQSDAVEEGLFVPVTRLFIRDEPNEELFRIIHANVRMPFEVVGDLYAQAASNDVGGARLVGMVEEFDLGDIESLSDEVCTRSERATREAIADLPDGVYKNEIHADGFDEPIRLAVSIRVDGDEMWVDYGGTSPQSGRGINVVLNYTAAYTTFGIKCAIVPEIPNNDGGFRPIHVSAPEGSILNALHPAPVGARHIVGHFLPGLIHGALEGTIPEKVLAEGAANLWNTQISGQREDGEPFTYVFFSGGGMEARPNKDGLSATAFPSGIRGVPAEVIESISPVVMHKREFRPDSEGPGQYRGGFGQEMEMRVRGDSSWVLSAMYDRNEFPAQGMQGGSPGNPGAVRIVDGEDLHPKRQQRIPAGGRSLLDLPGGGGFGDACKRVPAKVARDVEEGLISVERAREVYHVALKQDLRGRYVVDEQETGRLRKVCPHRQETVEKQD